MQAPIYNMQGKDAGKVELPDAIFNQPWNADLVYDVVQVMRGNARAGTANTKNRGEVRGGGKKPWKQKGTGRARHGSRRSPIWKGGGIAFGPRAEKDYSRKLNRNTRAKALAVVLSQKLRDGEMIFLDTLSFAVPKAKQAKEALLALSGIKGMEALATKRTNAALVVVPARNETAEKSFRNFGNVVLGQAKDINPVEILSHKYVIVADAEAAIDVFAARVATRAQKKTVEVAPVAEKKPKASPKKPAAKKTAKA
jgi:large subunit ribosomal protein L4